MSHFIFSGVPDFILSKVTNGPWLVALGLLAWAVAYVFLTRVITPDSIGDLMTLIVAVLPPLSALFALVVAWVSFSAKHWHPIQGVLFAIIVLVAGAVTFFQCKGHEIRKALKEAVKRRASSTIRMICWGSLGAIFVFASELFLIFGGWQFLQGSWLAGTGWVVAGAFIVAVGLFPGPRNTINPVRRAIFALKDHDKSSSVKFTDRLQKGPTEGEKGPPDWRDLRTSAFWLCQL